MNSKVGILISIIPTSQSVSQSPIPIRVCTWIYLSICRSIIKSRRYLPIYTLTEVAKPSAKPNDVHEDGAQPANYLMLGHRAYILTE